MNHYPYDTDDIDTSEMLCPGCKMLDPEMVWEDFGIGSYEYWGAPGTDIQWCYVTKCCEANVEDLIEFRPEPDDDEDEEETL